MDDLKISQVIADRKANTDRANEYKFFADSYRRGNDDEKKLAQAYMVLAVDYRYVAHCHGLIISPIPGMKEGDMNFAIVYRRLVTSHRIISDQHEAINKTIENSIDSQHKELTSFHRILSGACNNYAELLEGKRK